MYGLVKKMPLDMDSKIRVVTLESHCQRESTETIQSLHKCKVGRFWLGNAISIL